MPFYEYECASCKFYTEVMQKISDEPLTKCPSCGKKALKKLVSAPNFRLKGGGWYETDFKGDSENKRNLAGADKEESAAKPAADSSKGETVKAESPAADSSKGETSKPKTETKAEGASKSPDSKSAARKTKSGGRASKPPSRVAASRAKPAASRGKSKSSSPARKKARR
jgi:putative FmdB family regulatory protein